MIRRNNFDLLRLLMAVTVLLAHASELSLSPALDWIWLDGSTLAVQGFFVISGYLMMGSFGRSPSTLDFFRRRFLRIYPAYGAAVLLGSVALVSMTNAARFGADWMHYLAANLVFANWLHPGIAGVFEHNRLPAINGALWSMKFEVCCYLGVPVVFLLARRAGWIPVLCAIYASTAVAAGYVSSPLLHQLLGLVAGFVAGMALHHWRVQFDRARWPLLAFACVALAMRFAPAQPAAMAILVIAFARWTPHVDAAKFGDLSYGIYITHFPIIQFLVAAGLFASSPWLALAAAIVLPALAALLSWRFVESPFIRLAHTERAPGAERETLPAPEVKAS